jgi:hypothetical protein
MYQNFQIFNKNKQFLRISGLKETFDRKFLGRKVDLKIQNQFVEFESHIDEFMFKASIDCSHLSKMEQLKEIIKKQASQLVETSKEENERNPQCPIIQLSSDGILGLNTAFTNEFIANVSPFLRNLIVLQNRFVFILGIYLGIRGVPDVFSELFYDKKDETQVPSHKEDNPKPILNQFQDRVKYLTREYWVKYAKKLRKYRNIDEHRFNLSEYDGIDENGNYHLYLPDDPDIRTITKGTFHSKIDALDYSKQEFEAFVKYTNNVLDNIPNHNDSH